MTSRETYLESFNFKEYVRARGEIDRLKAELQLARAVVEAAKVVLDEIDPRFMQDYTGKQSALHAALQAYDARSAK